jgi:hypothetical protein
MSAIYDILFENSLTNTEAINLTATGPVQVYIALSNDPPDYGLDTAKSDVSPITNGDFQICTGTFSLTGSGSTDGIVTYDNATTQQFLNVSGTLSYVHLGWSGNSGTDITLICAFSSGTGFGSTLSSADVDITFDTGTNKIFKITS